MGGYLVKFKVFNQQIAAPTYVCSAIVGMSTFIFWFLLHKSVNIRQSFVHLHTEESANADICQEWFSRNGP